MRIIGFNQLSTTFEVIDLSKIRARIIEQECDRIGDVSVIYNGCTFHSDIRQALSTHLSQLRFEIVNDYIIKLGEVEVNVYHLVNTEYSAYGKTFKGSVEEIKKQVTKYLEKRNLMIGVGSDVWLGDNYIVPTTNTTYLNVKTHLIENEMKEIDKCLD